MVNWKLVIFGDGGIGKTSLLYRYLKRIFDENIQMTIGVDLSVKQIEIGEEFHRLRIWDFGGEERFKALLPGYASGASGGIFMYDITRYSSLKNLDEWLTMFYNGTEDEDIPILMVGGKLDLEEKRAVTKQDAVNLAINRKLIGHMECSSKTGKNVDRVFETITKEMIKRTKKA